MKLFTTLLAGARSIAKSIWAYATKEALSDSNNFITTNNITHGPGYIGFTNRTNYISIPVTTPTTSMDLIVKVHTQNSFSDYTAISVTASYKGMIWRQAAGSQSARIWLSTNGTSWNVCNATYPGLTIPYNADVWFRTKWDGTKYEFGFSTDGETYTWATSSYSNSNPIFWDTGYIYLGGCSWEDYAWQNNGLIDISGTKIYVDGNLIFNGSTAQAGTDFTIVGTLTYLEEYDYTNFTTDNYIKLDRPFDPGANPWEWKFKIKTGSSISNGNFIGAASNNYSIYLGTRSSGSKMKCWLSSNGTSWNIREGVDIMTLSTNTVYYMKFGYDGTNYYCEYSTDGETYTSAWTYTSALTISPVKVLRIGYAWGDYVFNGIFYLNEFYPTINDKLIWVCANKVIQVGDVVKLNDGLGYANYKWNAFNEYTTTTNQFTLNSTVKSISTDDESNTIYELESLDIPRNKVKINTKQIYDCFSNGTDSVYLKDGDRSAVNDFRYTNSNCYKGPGFYNFDTNFYLALPNLFAPESNTWEMKFHVRTGSDITTRQKIVGCAAGYDYAVPCLNLETSSYFSLNISSNGSSWNIANTNSTLKATANTDYWFKMYFTGTQYKLDYSLTGESYTNILTIDNLNAVYSNESKSFIALCADRYQSGSVSYPWKGFIYFKDCYIKINDEYWFDGSTQLIEDSNSYFIRGTLTENNKVYSGFTSSNYIILPVAFTPAKNTWEWFFKFKYTANSSSTQVIFSQGVGHETKVGVNTSGKVIFSISNSTWSYIVDTTGSTTLVDGNTYYIWVEFTGTAYNVYLSEDNENWTTEISRSSTATLEYRGDIWAIGANTHSSASYTYPFKGEIDLNESYIKIGNMYWFSGISATKLGYSIQSVGAYSYESQGLNIKSLKDNNTYAGLSSAELYLNRPLNFQNMDTWAITINAYFYNFRDDRLISTHLKQYVTPSLSTNGGYIKVWLSSNGSSNNIANGTQSSNKLNRKTWYYIKFYFTGTAYKVDVSTTGAFNGEEINYLNISSLNKIYSDTYSVLNFMNDVAGISSYYSDGKINFENSSFSINDTTYTLGWGHVTSQFYEKTSDTSMSPITVDADINVHDVLSIDNTYYYLNKTDSIATLIDFDKVYFNSTDDHSLITLTIDNDTVNLITEAPLTEDQLFIDTTKYFKFDMDYLTGYNTSVCISGKPFEPYEFPTYVTKDTDILLTLTRQNSTTDTYVKTFYLTHDQHLKKMALTFSTGNITVDKIKLTVNGSCNWEVTNTNSITIDVYPDDSIYYMIEANGYATVTGYYLVTDNVFLNDTKTVSITLDKIYKYVFNVTPANATIEFIGNNIYNQGDNWIQVYSGSFLKYTITADGYNKVENEVSSVSSNSTINVTLTSLSVPTLTGTANYLNMHNKETVITEDNNDEYIASGQYCNPSLNYYPYLVVPEVLPLNTANSWEIQTAYRYMGGGSNPLIFGSSSENFNNGGLKFYCRESRFRLSFYPTSTTAYLSDQALGSVTPEIGYEYKFKIGQTIEDNAWTANDGGGTKSTIYVDYVKSDRNVTTNYSPMSGTASAWGTYTPLEYIESTGSQYININIRPTDTTRVVAKVTTTTTSQNLPVFGTSNAEGAYFHVTAYNNKWYYGLNDGEGSSGYYNNTVGSTYIIDYNNNHKFIVNNQIIASNIYPSSLENATLYISKRYSNLTGRWRYHYVQIFENGTLTYDLMPAKRISDNVSGFYDLINNTFYPSLSGNFTAGPELNPDCISTSTDSNDLAFNAFLDGPLGWINSTQTPSQENPIYISYYSPITIKPTSFTIINDDTFNNMKNGSIIGSTDGINWDTLYTITNRPQGKNLSETYLINTQNKYNIFRIQVTERYSSYTEYERNYFIENNTQLQVTLADSFFNNCLYNDYNNGVAEFKYTGSTWSLNSNIISIANYLTITGTPENNDVIKVYYSINNIGTASVTSTNIGQIIIDGFPFTYSNDYSRLYTNTRDAKQYNIVDGELVENSNYVDWKNPNTIVPLAFLNTPLSLSDYYSRGHINLSKTKCYINGSLYWEAVHEPSVDEDVILTRGFGLDNNEYLISNDIENFNGDLSCSAKVTSISGDQISVTPNYYTTNSITINSKTNNEATDSDISTVFELPTKTITLNVLDSNGNVNDAVITLNTYKNDSRNIKLVNGYRKVYVESIPGQEIEFYLNNQKYLINDTNSVLDLDIIQNDFENAGQTFYNYIIREDGTILDEKICTYLNNNNLIMLTHIFKVNTDLSGCTITYTIGNKDYVTLDGQIQCYSGQTINYKIEKSGYATIKGTYTIPIECLNNSVYNILHNLDPLVTLTVNSSEQDSIYTIQSLGYNQTNNIISTKIGGVTIEGKDIKVADVINIGMTVTEEN